MSCRIAAVAFLFAIASSLSAATWVVPTDDALIRDADAVVVAHVVSSQARQTRGIRTFSALRVQDVLKGEQFFKPGQVFDVAEFGGVVGTRALVVPGSPRYHPNERVVVFLKREGDEWRTLYLSLGKFRGVDRAGKKLLVRGEPDEPITGVTADGRAHVERERDETLFVDYVRKFAHGQRPVKNYETGRLTRTSDLRIASLVPIRILPQIITAYPASAYCMTVSGGTTAYPSRAARWRVWDVATPPAVGYRSGGQQVNQTDSVGSFRRGLAAWTNETTSSITLSYLGTTTATKGFVSDNVNTIVFNDPSGEIAGSWTGAGVVATGQFWADLVTSSYKGETFYVVTEGDIVVQNGVTLSTVKFDEAMTHELGHTLAFRHSNDARQPSTTAAVMNSTLSGNYGTTLQSWDRSAAANVYAGTTTTSTCVAPKITVQPVSTSVKYGTSGKFSLTATGTGLKYQWYRGSAGVTTYPVSGATAATLTTPVLTSTTSFWARVTGTCGTVSSYAKTAYVCTAAPKITTQPASKTIAKNTSTTLTVTASGSGPYSYQWYRGTAGTTTYPVSTAASYKTPLLTVSTSYWVRVKNACGFANSTTATVRVQ